MGLLDKGWVWILTNDISPVLLEVIDSPEELAKYDGLMFISGLWDCKLVIQRIDTKSNFLWRCYSNRRTRI